jgi:dipeptidyl aminopeptidase/acylaminoacyl peptidase
MKNTLSLQCLRAFAAVCALAVMSSPGQAAPAATPAAQIPVQDFFRHAAASGPRLSPSGQKLALLIPADNGRYALAIADISNPTRFVGIARFDDADVANYGWINDDRLWFDAVDLQVEGGDQLGSGLFAVNADGSGFAKLIARRNDRKLGFAVESNILPGNRNRFAGIPNDGSDDVYIQRYEWVAEDVPPDSKMLRLNTRTREAKSIMMPGAPDGVSTWLLDRNREPRVAISSDRRTSIKVHWRDPANNRWKELTSYDSINPATSAFTPVAVDADGQLYVTRIDPATMDGAKTTALFRYAPDTGKMSEKPVVNIKGFDFDGRIMFDPDTKKALGITYLSDADGAVWFDPALKADQEAVDKLLPSTVNSIACNRCSTSRHVVVTAYSDRQSPVYFLYERASKKLTLIAASRPWLDSSKMAEQDFVRIKARDGLEFPAVITRPQGKGPFPTVVYVHGGPYVRGEEWRFAADTQFLASRGYLVIQPEYRGSTGYGDTLFRAGWKQWGLAMQDDITDATKWAIAQGLADPKRIAIAGASYGGYATMMGLVKEPELYKAGVNWVGVTDINLMYDIGWSDFMSSKWMRYGMPRMIGDPSKDAEQLRATSPLKQAARIKQPVLMAYGVEDYRVPLPHGTKMRDALKASGNNDVEWIAYEGEGHGWMLVKNNVDFWTRVENFLARNLK